FNVYGVWEGASLTTDSWFQGTEPKCLDELKPWLITRRYSWLRDLKGALPPVAGAPHDNLLAELDDPAWHPIMVRASTIEDRSSDSPSVSSDRKLPNAIRPGLTIWSFDLRQGMGSGVHSMRRGWDPSAPIVTSWTPYHWRHDDLTSGSVRPVPQRYRFWVTCVDALDQESPPIAVRTADSAAGEGETHIFTPRHRTPLPSPPQHEELSPRAIKISADTDRRRIEVRFSVPDRFHLGSQDVEGTTPGLIDPSTLLAKVVLVRRQLVARINTERFELLSHDDPVLASPPWQHALEELGKEGWARFPPAIEVVPRPDGTCVAHFTLDHVDRGFEYRAVIGFAIARDLMHFWYPPVRTRLVHGTKKSGNGEFEAAPPELIFEAPAIGGIAQTAVLPLPNRAPPRDASSGAGAMHWAKPVLPPPGVNRDRVLMRLLSNPVASAPPKEAPEPPSLAAWLAEGLNLAQAHMAHAAMARVAFDSANAPSEGQWDMLRRWIAHDLKEPSTGLRQHGLVGFRGLMALDWNYTPIAKQRPADPAQPGGDSEAEATLFRIYTARASTDARGESKPDLKLVVQSATGDLCRTNPIELDPILARLLKSGFQPALVAIRRDATELAYATAHDFRGSAENQIDTIVLRPLPADGALPPLDGATCLIYLAALAADVKNEHFGSESDAMRCYVPVGGGPNEAMAWWVAAVSAQEVLSPANGWPVHFHSFPASIQLPAPAAPVARSVVNSSEPWLAADAVPAHWRPAKLTDATAPYEVRTFVTWDKSDFPADTWIEIDRVSRGLGETMRALAEPEVFEEWKALKLIEATDDGAPLDPVWIERVARQWLLGFAVEPDPTDPLPPPPYVAFPARELKPESGLALVDPQPADPAARPGPQDKRRPALVDYFAKDNVSLMESDTEYRYRVRIVQDVAPDAPKEWR
ncbi:MAG: hypothetical protein JSR72_23695, partial [Proteobacteria bacterium]|nr:hypothetical protein [Pseudomonadota bacterium]